MSFDLLPLLRMAHVVSFAAWFGTVLASLFLLKTLEPKLTGEDGEGAAREAALLLRRYIGLETKVADGALLGLVASGIAMAFLHHGWTGWVWAKVVLLILQAALTMGWIIRFIQPITYPCTPRQFAGWYRLFALSLSMFALVLSVVFLLH
ncbi:hypothetical protein [Chlorobium sp. N1]|uniref:hypothetical protein n=1 Tax=Chlorobium sp. N1 TaxID=2491138 RepID=UPI0010389D98|nr:hypothetical protein [Chlorobium sp. N1]TCD48663.1 hypothetical protein E0L29_01920 [Chlorobium sp. N1]